MQHEQHHTSHDTAAKHPFEHAPGTQILPLVTSTSVAGHEEHKVTIVSNNPWPTTIDTAQLVPPFPSLTEGRIVHYVAYNNRHLAAIVIGHAGDTADLTVFTNMENVNGVKNFGLQFHQGIAHSENKEPGTWHWIEA